MNMNNKFINIEKSNIKYEIIGTSETINVHFDIISEDGCYTPNHWHSAVEILYVLDGELTITINAKEYLITAGNCIVINANVIHSVKSIQYDKYLLLQIPLSFIEKYVPNIYTLNFSLNDAENDSIQRKRVKVFKHILRKMKEVDEVKPAGFLLLFNQLLFKLIHQLYSNFCEKVYQSDGSQRKKEILCLNKILAYIVQNYNRQITLEEIAKVAGFQPKYFCRFFKKHIGITFKEYQNELRLSFIYRNLLDTDDSVATILERHGFTNYKLFRKMFKMQFNDTPMGVRKKISESVEND